MTDTQTDALRSSGNDNSLDGVELSFIGCGVMAEAMIAGLLRQQLVTAGQLTGSHPRAARRDELESKYGIRMVESNRAAAAAEVVSEDDAPGSGTPAPTSGKIVILAVKPQRLGGVLHELKGALVPDGLVISIIAGATIETISGELLHGAVVRAMP